MATIPINNMTDTWNNVATTFRSILMNVTNTNSATPSYLMDLQVAGGSKANIDKSGNISAALQVNATGTMATPAFAFSGVTTTGFYNNNAGLNTVQIGASCSGSAVTRWVTGEFDIVGNAALAWMSQSNTFSSAVQTVYVSNEAFGNGAVSIKGGTLTSPCAFRVYNTADSITGAGTNWERGVFDWTTAANTLTIGTQAGGTGTVRGVSFVVGSTGALALGSSAAQFYVVGNSGNIQFGVAGTGAITWISSGVSLSYTTAAAANSYVCTNNNANGVSIQGIFGWGSTTTKGSASDLMMARVGAATLQFGADVATGNLDKAAPVAQIMQVQSVIAGTSNTAGVDWTHIGSKGTGTGAGGNIVFQTATAGTTGTSQNSPTTMFTLRADQTIQLNKAFTVATLPAAGTQGRIAYVTDATAPTYNAALTGGGAVVVPVFDNGTAWVSH